MRRLGIVLFLVILPLPASAWTRASDERIALKGAALAPPDLRAVIMKYEADLKSGIGRARADEGSDSHVAFQSTRKGRLRERIEGETRAAVQMIRGNKPMSGVVEKLGVIAHLVADANNPFHASNEDARLTPLRGDYAAFFEQKLSKFPTVFYGLDRNFQLGPYLDKTLRRSARFYPLVRAEYFKGGERRTSASFDDRSTAFGVAAISYSRSVSDLVNIYYYIWKEAGGDVRSAAVMYDGNLLLNAQN